MSEHRICATCCHASFREDGNIACGAGVDDGALAEGRSGANPIWAERKYGRSSMLALLTGQATELPPGSDCEDLSPVDGARCATWAARHPISAPHIAEHDASRLPLVIARVAEAWMADTSSIPAGVTVDVSRSCGDYIHDSGVRERIMVAVEGREAFLDAAARYIAPGWEVSVETFVGGRSRVFVERYRP